MADAQLPLHCCICPKKPNFSDVSHLLTHVASKGHLSHYYKTKVRSGQDEASRTLVEAYDAWYIQWNVEHLMSDRMNLKANKKPRTKKQFAESNPPKKIKLKPLQDVETQCDPFFGLAAPTGERFEDFTGATDLFSMQPVHNSRFVYRRVRRPLLHLWSTKQPNSYEAIALEFSSPPQPPFLRLPPPAMQAAPIAPMIGGSQVDNDEGGSTEATRLKGVCWPGMDVFDSATPETRRKRNQKKNTSVVSQLAADSLEIEPTEMIFTPLGSLQRSRFITGLPSSSPIKVDSPTPRLQHDSFGRIPLLEKDPNRKRSTAGPYYTLAKSSQISVGAPALAMKTGNTKKTTTTKKQKRKFDVYNEEQPEFANPVGMKHLTSGFDEPPRPRGRPRRQAPQNVDAPQFAAPPQGYYPRFEHFPQTLFPVPYYNYPGAQDLPPFFSQPVPNMYAQLLNELNNAKNEDRADDDHTVSATSDA